MVRLLLSALLFVCLSPWARADMLYLDTDNAPEEVKAMQDAAKARHETLVVLPPRTPEEEKVLEQMHRLAQQWGKIETPAARIFAKEDPIKDRIQKLRDSPHPDSPKLEKLELELSRTQDAYHAEDARLAPLIQPMKDQIKALREQVHAFQASDLDALLKSYHDQGKTFDTVVISGHHDSGEYWGVLGAIRYNELDDTFHKYPDVRDGVRTFLGWGCYSTIKDSVSWFKEMFPNIQLAGGFDQSAPSSFEPSDTAYLKNLLIREAAVRKVAAEKEAADHVRRFERIVRAIPGFMNVNGAVYACGMYESRHEGAMDFADLAKTCTPEVLTRLQTAGDRYRKILDSVDPSVEDIPCDTQHSWLRDYYNDLRDHLHCGSIPIPEEQEFKKETVAADQVIRLILFKNVFANFKRFYQPQLDSVAKLADRCGLRFPNLNLELKCEAPPPQDPEIPTITRKEILDGLGRFQSCNPDSKPSPDPTPTNMMDQKYWDYWWPRISAKMQGKSYHPPVPPKVVSSDDLLLNHMAMKVRYLLHGLKCTSIGWAEPEVPGQALISPTHFCGPPSYFQ